MNNWIIAGVVVAFLAIGIFAVNGVFAQNSSVSASGNSVQPSCSQGSCSGQCSGSCNAGKTCGCANCAAKTGGSCGCGK